jgi:hypothetical protein
MSLFIALLIAIPQEDDRPKELRELESLRGEVETLRVLGEAKVTKEQAEKLLEAIADARKKIDESVKGASDALEALKKGETLSDDKRRAQGEAQGRIGEIFRAMEEATRGLQEKVKSILDAGQLEEFSWMTRHDPAGQLRQWSKHMMVRVREMPDEAVDGMAEGILDFFSRFRGLPEESREEEAERVWKIISESRSLAAEEFEKKKGELLKKVTSEGKIAEISKKMPRGPEMENMTGRFFLQSRVERALKARVK